MFGRIEKKTEASGGGKIAWRMVDHSLFGKKEKRRERKIEGIKVMVGSTSLISPTLD